MAYTYIDETEAYEQYDNELDELYPILIGYIEFQASRVLKELDPIAYSCGFNDWLDNRQLTIDETDNEEEEN